MDVQDKDIQDGFTGCYRAAIKSCKYFFHIAFLESCKYADNLSKGLLINKSPFISFISDDIETHWKDTIKSTESMLLETLIYGINDKRQNFEICFWTTNDHCINKRR